jgi:predicted TIM-barrel fold metal-dependent hydrolase
MVDAGRWFDAAPLDAGERHAIGYTNAARLFGLADQSSNGM